MNRYALATMAACCLAACAMTPEQQAAHEAFERTRAQRLQTALAAQCSPKTAVLMQRQFGGDTGKTAEEKLAFKLAYAEALNDEVFRACYRLALENHIAQSRLQAAYQRDYEAWWYGRRGWSWLYW